MAEQANANRINFRDNLGMDLEMEACSGLTVPKDKLEKMERLAREILNLARSTLLVNLRFLDAALSQFRQEGYDGTYATDGKKLLFSAEHVLYTYRDEQQAPVRDYLHIVLHCVFQHMYVHNEVDRPCWDLACDMAVENVINELGLPSTEVRKSARQQLILEGIREQTGSLTAERIYRYYAAKELPPQTLAEIRDIFFADDHELWYYNEEPQKVSDEQDPNEDPERKRHNAESSTLDHAGEDREAERSAQEQVWKRISQRMQTDLETFSRQQGDKAGGLMQTLARVNREQYDYSRFLKKFAVMGEIMKINDDEFDYIFYTYGLRLYKNLPLVEPLEYKEVRRIKDFAIAIDTSASVSGELVQAFVQKTYNILKSTESYFRRINLHIIQCDAEIQEDIKITSQEDFDRYMETMEIRGLGGTDYRPVFRYLDDLIRAGEFEDLKGLIYFTDGHGTFPAKKPEYQTAFVFVEDPENSPTVPPWAIRLILSREELEDMEEE